MEERYTILGELGSGGFGSVYKARDEMLCRDVAIKRLDVDLCAEELLEQLLKEARVLAAVQHPNIVSIYDITTKASHAEIVMELLVGVSFDRLVKRHLLQASDLRNVAGQVLKALEAAHEVGVLHCDLKPENLMLCLSSGGHYETKVYDFGLSKPSEDGEGDGKTKLMGSIYVMAPELFNGKKVSIQSDLYALGCILYYLLVGQYPFVGDSSVQVMASHITGNHVPLSVYRKDLPSELCLWVETLIKTDVGERFGNCKDALEGLRATRLFDEESTFTLPMDLEIEGTNSRLVRNLSKESLDPSDGVVIGENTTTFLDNSFGHSAPVGVMPALPETKRMKVSGSIGEVEEVILPEDAEWYFSDGDKVKGPVNLEQLKRLCLRGKVVEESLVWHSMFRDWVVAASCAETVAAFADKKSFADAEIARLEAMHLRRLREGDVGVGVEKRGGLSWLGIEVYGVVAASVLAAVLFSLFPDWREAVTLVYVVVLLGLGLTMSRIYQRREKVGWGYFVPVLGDVFYGFKAKCSRVTLCLVMVLFGTAGLSMEGVHHVVRAEARNDETVADAELGAKLFEKAERNKEERNAVEAERKRLAVEAARLEEERVRLERLKSEAVREDPAREAPQREKTLSDLLRERKGR